MKRFFLVVLTAMASVVAMAQSQSDIVFEKDTINLGKFTEADAVQTCVFKFRNTGDAPLIIHQAIATCGCTVPDYDRQPVKPGETGEIKVTYNGRGKLIGPFTKTISVRSNAKAGIKRLYLKGEMTQ